MVHWTIWIIGPYTMLIKTPFNILFLKAIKKALKLLHYRRKFFYIIKLSFDTVTYFQKNIEYKGVIIQPFRHGKETLFGHYLSVTHTTSRRALRQQLAVREVYSPGTRRPYGSCSTQLLQLLIGIAVLFQLPKTST